MSSTVSMHPENQEIHQGLLLQILSAVTDHICSLTFLAPTSTVLTSKSTPIVLEYPMLKSSSEKRFRILDFPQPLSPITRSLHK